MTETVLQQRIKQKLAEHGVSAWEVSKRATGNPDTIRYILRGHKPNYERLALIAAALETTPEWLSGEQPGADQALRDFTRDFRPDFLPVNLPVLGTVLGSDLDFSGGDVPVESHLVEMGDAIRFVRRPKSLDGARNAYALYVAGSSMSPRFEPGEMIYIDPRRHPSIGDDVVVQLLGEQEGDDGPQVVTALIKRLTRRTSAFVELKQFQPDRCFQVPVARISAIHRVVPWGELLGG